MIGDKYRLVRLKTKDEYGNTIDFTKTNYKPTLNIGDILEVETTYFNSRIEVICFSNKTICEVGSKFEKYCLERVDN